MKAILFDVDGTLIDSVDLHARAWRDAFAHFGKELEYEDVRRQIGKGGDQLMPVFLTPEECDRFGEELDAFRSALFRRAYLPLVKPFARVRELFERVLATGKRVALASSELEAYKHLVNVADLVQAETAATDVAKSKPHPDVFEAALRELGGVDPREALVVGDTPYDAIAATRAGMGCVGVLCGGFPEAALRRAGCVYVYETPAAILEQFDQTPLAG